MVAIRAAGQDAQANADAPPTQPSAVGNPIIREVFAADPLHPDDTMKPVTQTTEGMRRGI